MSGTARTVHFELCAESVEAVHIADECGADRTELCVNLAVGGTTPPLAMIRDAIHSVSIPVHILIRPRAGDFVYSRQEFEQMKKEICEAKAEGAGGVALGILALGGSVDVPRTKELVELARPMTVTFHRAFDETRAMDESLEAVIATGAQYLLTSGGRSGAMEGADAIAQLVRQANERIMIMAGGGLQLSKLRDFIETTGVEWVHGSLTRAESQSVDPAQGSVAVPAHIPDLVRENLQEVTRLLNRNILSQSR